MKNERLDPHYQENENPGANDQEEEIDYSARVFDYRDTDANAAMICEHDEGVRGKIRENLRTLNLKIVEPATFKEAYKYMAFQTFNVIVINENFDMGKDGVNHLHQYLESLHMSVRRHMFVVMISSNLATMDYMYSLNKSVNLIVNTEDISEIGLILKREMEENEYFYHVFRHFQQKFGKV